jgi:hypothetical protein
MRKKALSAFLFLLIPVILVAEGGLSVSVTLAQRAYLPGEPITAHVRIINTSQAGVTFYAPTVTEGVRVTARLKNEAGEIYRCGGISFGITVPQDPSRPVPESTLAPDKSFELDCPADTLSCPIASFPPGRYAVLVDVTKVPKREKEPWPRLALVEEKIEIMAPTGEDLAAIQAIERAVTATDPKDLHGPTLSQVPLRWEDILQSLRMDSRPIILSRFPTSTYAGYVIAKKLLDLSDWRFKVGTPASAIQAGKEHPEWATRSQSDVELFNLVEKHIQGGNVPESLRAVLYCYYGEQLILRGRAAEAEAAFCQAVKEKPGDAKGEAYFTRAQQFLDALNKHGA